MVKLSGDGVEFLLIDGHSSEYLLPGKLALRKLAVSQYDLLYDERPTEQRQQQPTLQAEDGPLGQLVDAGRLRTEVTAAWLPIDAHSLEEGASKGATAAL